MATSEHTPGPWVARGDHIFGPKDPRSKLPNGRSLVGGVVDDHFDWRGRPCEDQVARGEFRAETEANARLIAAAPLLLEAAEDVAYAWRMRSSPDGRGVMDSAHAQLDRAIAAARGEGER